jgi:murein DD-endopeptidase MepM/ murein hydrolase activator NlpD
VRALLTALTLCLAAASGARAEGASSGDLWDLYATSKKAIEAGRPVVAPGTEASLYGPITLEPRDASWEREARRSAAQRSGAARVARAKSAPDFLLVTNAARMTSDFGMRNDPMHGGSDVHAGIDLAAPYGTQILAAQDGVVRFAGLAGGYGYMLEIEHADGTRSRYAHCSRLLVDVGHRVTRADVVAKVGSTGRSTGDHLHFEVRRGGLPIDPVAALQRYARQSQQRDRALLASVAAEDAKAAQASAKRSAAGPTVRVAATTTTTTTPTATSTTVSAPATRSADPF